MTFGYGANFPAKYQKRCSFWTGVGVCRTFETRWKYPQFKKETFITGSPLPVTDAIIHPVMARCTLPLCRKVQSGLYRVSYVGKEKSDPVTVKPQVNELASLRYKLENLHIGEHPDAVNVAWPHIDHPDRFIRWAALMAIQRLPVEKWANRALSEKNQGKRAYALLFAKATGIDPYHRKNQTLPLT